MSITCPWPPRELSPNARCHWHKKSKAAKSYRAACHLSALRDVRECQDQLSALKSAVEAGGTIHLFIDFVQPDRRARDDDNVIAAFKSGRDGIAQALGIDDKHFRIHPVMTDEVVKGGAVRVRLATWIIE